MRSHPYAGAVYPVSRSEAEVQGLKAYKSVAELPPTDLAAMIIPAQLRAAGAGELRQGRHQGRDHSLVRLCRGEGRDRAGAAAGSAGDRREIRHGGERAERRGLRQHGGLRSARPSAPRWTRATCRCLPRADRTRGQVAVISQSGGMGFAFFDHGRPKELSFRYIITTGNEACLTASDFAEFIIDEGKTAAVLMLIEDIKNIATFERAAGKALRAGVPLIVNRLGASEAGARAIAAHTAAQRQRCRISRAVREVRRDREQRSRRDGRYRGGVRRHGQPPAGEQPRRDRVVLRRRRRLGGGCLRARRPRHADPRRCGAGEDRRVSAALRHLAEPGRCHGAGHSRARLCGVRAARRPSRRTSTA